MKKNKLLSMLRKKITSKIALLHKLGYKSPFTAHVPKSFIGGYNSYDTDFGVVNIKPLPKGNTRKDVVVLAHLRVLSEVDYRMFVWESPYASVANHKHLTNQNESGITKQ